MITTLITTSPIPSHPSTEILDKTIQKVRQYTDGLILILCDGVHESLKHRTEDYNKYVQSLTGRYKNSVVIQFGGHQHQARMTRYALEQCATDLIFFVEHDTYIDGDIPFNELCKIVEETDINYLRFNIFDCILPEHRYLMLGNKRIDGHSFQKTIQYSSRPFIAKKAWMQDLLRMHFDPEHRTMIEDVMHGIVQSEYYRVKRDTFGMVIYTPEGNQLRSFHSDGRKDDTKIIEA